MKKDKFKEEMMATLLPNGMVILRREECPICGQQVRIIKDIKDSLLAYREDHEKIGSCLGCPGSEQQVAI